MPDGSYLYCDVSLPVPLDQPFTYALPETLRHRVKPGCRILVPFGSRRLTGVAIRCHDEPPGVESRAEGRFALYSSPDAGAADDWARVASTPAKGAVSVPEVVEELDYEQLTLAQLRARLPSLDLDELEALLAYEEATKGRAPFQTLLANRITRATAK